MVTITSRRAALIGIGASVVAAPAYASRRHDAQVIVIGAGISGLETALRLEAAGMDVLVVEASRRIGGRLLTWSDLPGSPNAGGVQIGASYDRLRSRAAALNTELLPEPTSPRANRIAIGSTLIDPAAWAASPLNPFPSAFKAVQPGGALFATGGRSNPLLSLDDWRGPKGIAADVSSDAFLAQLGFDPAARTLVDIGLNANQLSSYSMVNVWRSLTLFAADRARGAGSFMVRGGSQALPEAMAKALKRPVRLGQEVSRIRVDAQGAEVQIGRRTLRAAAVIAAIPFPALRAIPLTAPISAPTREAIAGLPYTQIIQMVVEPKTKYWETDGLPIDMWTDGPLERVFSIRESSGADTGQLMIWLNGSGASFMDEAVSNLSLAMLMGEFSDQLARRQVSSNIKGVLADAGRKPILPFDPRTFVAEKLKALRPASGGDLRVVRSQRWTASNSLAGGAYVHWAPGQIARWAGKMGRPAGRLFFAGEHLGLVHTGMEAAFESAEQTAGDVVAALRAT